MKSQRDIEAKLLELKKDRFNLHLYIRQRGTPATLPDLMATLTQQIDEHSISAKIDITEWILKDHPF